VEALRSGKYRQGRNKLQSLNGRYCCLGVLCDLHAKETGGTWTTVVREPGRKKAYFDTTYYLPGEVQRWAGVAGDNPAGLGARNDDGASFEEIAKIIEAEL
jgi:hypothetical protein